MDWDKLRVFHAVARAGSFTHAGDTLNLSQSAVSRQISALEDSLDVPLFHRHARGLILTEQGEMLFQAVNSVFAKLAMVEARLSESKDKPRGPLKITTTVSFGSVWLTPRLKEFFDLYPEIEVTVTLTDRDLDLSMREADVALRMLPPTQPDLIQRHLMTMPYRIYATHEYLEKYGEPKTPKDLDKHNIISFGERARPPFSISNWLMELGVNANCKRKPLVRVNSIYGIFRAVSGGLGLGALPTYMAHDTRNDLVEVLPDLKNRPILNIYFVYAEELRYSKRITVFRDFLLKKISEMSAKKK